MNRRKIRHKVRIDFLERILEEGWVESERLCLGTKEWISYTFYLKSEFGLIEFEPFEHIPSYSVKIKRLGSWVRCLNEHAGRIVLVPRSTDMRSYVIIKNLFTDYGIKKKLEEMTGIPIRKMLIMFT